MQTPPIPLQRPVVPCGVGVLARVNDLCVTSAASTEGPPEEVEALPATAHAISGQTYLLDPNIYGMSELRLRFPGGDEAILELAIPEVIGGPTFEIQIGLDNVNRFTPGRHGVMTAAKGGWISDKRFSAVVDEIALINQWQWDLIFEDDAVTFDLRSLAGGELPATITGTLAP